MEANPADIKRRIDAGEAMRLIDVREPQEFQITRIGSAQLVPMSTVPARLGELESAAESATLIVYCHHGMRSLQVVNWLRQQGVAACQSMAGGIDRWSLEVDRTVARY